ncbi:unnamed protein product [Macrosiphum euphorbiae]|uniref:Uncharacterized protein n=1 Tax=Macrosiphum euphorbiae TaxID=13131 RepID=A0AAV0W8I9_9HEMI|nr:unnamed protein product [Macrosiphum euphorbiae]
MPLFQVPFKPIKPQDYKAVSEYQASVKCFETLAKAEFRQAHKSLPKIQPMRWGPVTMSQHELHYQD